MTRLARARAVTAGMALAAALTMVTALPAGGAGASARSTVGSGVPASAMGTRVGVTPTTVTIGNIATHFETLFTGAAVGTQAYADYVNARGGVNGRKIMVTVQNTGLSGTADKRLTQAATSSDFALVGGFSVTDTSAAQVLAEHPSMPDVQMTLSPSKNTLPNVVNPSPLGGGWEEGSLLYFKRQDPAGAKDAAAMVADEPSAVDAWQGQEATMKHVGYKIAYENTFAVSAKYETFVTDVLAMKNMGIKMLFIEQNPPLYAAPLIRALNSQDFHPVVVLGASTYSNSLIATSGGASAVDGMYLEQSLCYYLGQDSKAIPAVTTFLHWVQVARPGWQPDLFTLYGWLSAQLFTQGLKKAGEDPSRGSLLKALGTITTFSGTHLETPVDPAAKTLSNCYLIGRIEGGKWVRQGDPPVTGATHGYRCTDSYYVPPGTDGHGTGHGGG